MQTRNEPVRARELFMEMQWKIGTYRLIIRLFLHQWQVSQTCPFRTLCKEQGAGLICMEMISAKAISFHNKNTIALMEIDPCEHPVSMQLFGSEPDLMAEVAKSIEDRDFDILDINMGCPVPKVVNNGEGSALLKNPNGTLPQLLGPGQEFMACVVGAGLLGFGIGIVFCNNGSTGGTDIIAWIINKYKDVTLGRMMMYCDIVIISSCYFIFHDWKRGVVWFLCIVYYEHCD